MGRLEEKRRKFVLLCGGFPKYGGLDSEF